jgi:hypothetical protein
MTAMFHLWLWKPLYGEPVEVCSPPSLGGRWRRGHSQLSFTRASTHRAGFISPQSKLRNCGTSVMPRF